MMSRIRWLVMLVVGWSAMSVAAAAPVPVPAEGKYEPPTATFHTLSGEKMLDGVKAYLKLAGGEEMAKQLDENWLGFLFGKNVAPALDLTRPICGYGYLRDNLEESGGILVVPTTSEKAVLALFEKLQLTAKAEPTAGRYKLSTPNAGLPIPLFAQFADGGKLLYFSINNKPEVLNKDQLIPVAKLVDAKATTHLNITVYPDRVPNSARQLAFDFIDNEILNDLNRLEQRAPRDMPAGFPAFAKEVVNLGKRNLGALLTEARSVHVTGHLNAKTGNLDAELVILPKSNTPFATDIAAIKGPTGRFHQLLTKDSVLGGGAGLPTLPKALREKGAKFLTDWIALGSATAPAEAKPVFDAASEQVTKLLASGAVDAGFAMTGPNKAGRYTAIAAIALDDSAALDKAFRTAAKAAGEFIKLDAAKLGNLPVHEVNPKPAMTPELAKVFGDEPKLRLMFSKDALYAAFGDDGEAELQRALNLKPTAGPVFDVSLHGARSVKLLPKNVFNDGLAEIGNRIDGFASYLAVEVSGGKEFRVKLKTAQPILIGMIGARANQRFEAVPGAVPPPPIKK